MLFYLGIGASEPVRAWASAPPGLREIKSLVNVFCFVLVFVHHILIVSMTIDLERTIQGFFHDGANGLDFDVLAGRRRG